ncbi:hypothetical protein ASG89_32020 [Paenibacillus sp. Soil766]|uniref:GNAT family N-acetyltransferase n=1 Tax=Paenibacillus sp. Soil766 TaxID=1736404 RepID=UPI00070D2449|nr:GNAT family N-acetyltransferase [Paenibacillus sp. Soil766]KRE94920.1 hypothetical protein ASG89_32020 [Paenibacillus sp. Soil766]
MTNLPNTWINHSRPAVLEDAAAITDLIMACDIAEYGVPDIVIEDTIEILNGIPLSTNTWVIFVDDQIVSFGFLEEDQTGKLSFYGYVHPSFIGQGLGSVLLGQMEERALQYKAEQPEVVWHLSNVIPVNNKRAVSLVEDRGYRFKRLYSRMTMELKGPQTIVSTADSIMICPSKPGSEPALYAAYCEAFQDTNRYRETTYEAWVAAKSGDQYDRKLWFSAYDGDELVGFIISKNFKDHVFVDLLGVRRAWRKSGTGLALLQTVFQACYEQGIEHVQLSVDAASLTGANRLYERAGMTASFQMGFYEKELLS